MTEQQLKEAIFMEKWFQEVSSKDFDMEKAKHMAISFLTIASVNLSYAENDNTTVSLIEMLERKRSDPARPFWVNRWMRRFERQLRALPSQS